MKHPQTARRSELIEAKVEAYNDGYKSGLKMAEADIKMLREMLTAQQRETLRAAQEAERYRAALEEILAGRKCPLVVPCRCPACIASHALGGEEE